MYQIRIKHKVNYFIDLCEKHIKEVRSSKEGMKKMS